MQAISKIITLFFFICIAAGAYAQPHGSLLVGNKADNNVAIFDVATKKQLALIPVGDAPHELAVSPSGKIAAVCNYGASNPGNSLSIIDIPGKLTIKTIDLGKYTRPHGIEFINEEEVIITSESTKNLIRVNVITSAVRLVAFTDQERSHMVAWSASDQMAYVSNILSGSVSAISVKDNKLIRQVNVKKGIEGIAVSPDGKEVWVANRDDSNVVAINTSNWETLAVIPAHQLAYRVRFLLNGKYAMVSNGNAGNLSVYDVAKKKLIKDIDFYTLSANAQLDAKGEKPDQPVPGGITVSEDSRYIFVSSTGYKLAVMIDTNTWTIIGFFPTGNVPDGIYYSPVTVGR